MESSVESRAEERKASEKLFSRLAALIKILAESGRTEDIVRVTEDEEYREQLFEEHEI